MLRLRQRKHPLRQSRRQRRSEEIVWMMTLETFQTRTRLKRLILGNCMCLLHQRRITYSTLETCLYRPTTRRSGHMDSLLSHLLRHLPLLGNTTLRTRSITYHWFRSVAIYEHPLHLLPPSPSSSRPSQIPYRHSTSKLSDCSPCSFFSAPDCSLCTIGVSCARHCSRLLTALIRVV